MISTVIVQLPFVHGHAAAVRLAQAGIPLHGSIGEPNENTSGNYHGNKVCLFLIYVTMRIFLRILVFPLKSLVFDAVGAERPIGAVASQLPPIIYMLSTKLQFQV
jgi:hypothetical protein